MQIHWDMWQKQNDTTDGFGYGIHCRQAQIHRFTLHRQQKPELSLEYLRQKDTTFSPEKYLCDKLAFVVNEKNI